MKEVIMAGSNNSNSQRGFASMDESKQKSIASKGGKATGGKNLSTEARSKGGKNSHSGGGNNS
jgi:general stress protein YciG